jgi:hypothetical protein
MAKGRVPEIQVWKLRDKYRQLQAAVLALEAKNQGQAVEIEQLRSALRGAHEADKANDAEADQLASPCQTRVIVSHLRGSLDQLLKLLGHGLASTRRRWKKRTRQFRGL